MTSTVMTPRFSLYLDGLRLFAAIVVFISHFAYERFSGGFFVWFRELNFGSDAVVIFFVLSGFLIAYTAQNKDADWKKYSFNRLTRLYSVVVPAVIVTLCMDRWGVSINSEVYHGFWYQEGLFWKQCLYAFTFANEWFGKGFRIGTNGPYWSLSYEAAYYLLFGVVVFMSGVRRWLCLIPLLFMSGMLVLLLLPTWLMGVAVYHRIQRGVNYTRLWGWAMILLPLLVYCVCLWGGVPHFLLVLESVVLGEEFVEKTLRFSDEFLWNIFLAGLVSIHLLGVFSVSRNKDETRPKETRSFTERAIRWGAGGSFTLYIVHYPALQFVDAVLPQDMTMVLRNCLLLAVVVLFCFAFAEISERRLKWFRNQFMRFRKAPQ